MDMFLTLLARACAASLAYFFYRIAWVTRNAGPYKVSKVPLVAPMGGGG